MLKAKKLFLQTSYEPLPEVFEYLASQDGIRMEEREDLILFYPKISNGTGVIFYPGAKVVFSSYSLLIGPLANAGYTVCLLRMPEDLANRGVNRPDEIFPLFPDLSHWFLGGHSLGGSTAARYVSAHLSNRAICGLFLLGSYSIQDFSQTELPMLLVYGDSDQIVKKERIFFYQDRFSQNTTLKEIVGGNHSFFGSYGNQTGDGQASIDRSRQQQETREILLSFFHTVLSC